MRRSRHSLRPVVEGLDRRELPAAAVSATLARGVLTVVGTEEADVLRVLVLPRPARPTMANIIRVDGVARAFPASRVQRIVIAGLGGNDALLVEDNGLASRPAWLDGGAGNDTLLGGAGNDTLLGNAGDDLLVSRGGVNFTDGGPGLDWVDGVTEIPPAPSPTPTPTPVHTTPPASTTPVTTTPAPTTPAPSPSPTPTPSPLPTGGPSTTLSSLETDILDLTNSERAAAGLAPLTLSSKLVEAARIQANNMVATGVFAHEIPGTETPTLSDRARKVGYRGSYVGENIAFGYLSASSLMRGWMDSPGHRANILQSNYTEIGVAAVYNATGRPYYVQVFGRPMA